MHRLRLVLFVCGLSLAAHAYAGKAPVGGGAAASPEVQVICLDDKDSGRVFDGIGGLSAGAASRLLIDYPEPQRTEILDLLFKPHFGASLQVLKVEIGGTVNSTWGAEPSHANTREELVHPKPAYCQRGYEWWLMKEARKRNPGIILESLQWGAPGWIGNGEYFSQDNADYIVGFLKAARDIHGVSVNYQGIRNEAGYKTEWIKTLREALDKNGLHDVKLEGTDSTGSETWKIVSDTTADPPLSKTLSAVGVHYPAYSSPDAARQCGLPLWDEEDAFYGAPWARADAFARLYNQNYIVGRMTKTIVCTPITSLYDNLAPFNVKVYNNPGLMLANTPWSGHYDVPPALWATAHTTQFTAPGWRYLDGGCGNLGNSGSYVALRSPGAAGDYSIIIETMQARPYAIKVSIDDGSTPDIPARKVKFSLKNLSGGTLHVWRSNQSRQFVPLSDIMPNNGSFEILLEGNSIYSLTTTSGQRKGSFGDIPKNSSFPFPKEEDFERYTPGDTARYLSDQEGTFAVVEQTNGRGRALRQMVQQRGIEWFVNMQSPWTIIGDADWKDYEVGVDVRIADTGLAGLYGRIDDALSRPMPGGYGLTIDHAGVWQLKDSTTVLATGTVRTKPGFWRKLTGAHEAKAIPGAWHKLQLRFSGDHVIAAINGKTVCRIMDDFHSRGAIALASSYDPVEFDNLAIKSFQGRTPKATAQWRNLALGAKTTASSQLNADNNAEQATDGQHPTGWRPQAGRAGTEWLEVDLGKATTFDMTTVDQRNISAEGLRSGISGYKIQYWDGGNWKDASTGGAMAIRQSDHFAPVVARKIRLLITARAPNCCVREFQVFRRMP